MRGAAKYPVRLGVERRYNQKCIDVERNAGPERKTSREQPLLTLDRQHRGTSPYAQLRCPHRKGVDSRLAAVPKLHTLEADAPALPACPIYLILWNQLDAAESVGHYDGAEKNPQYGASSGYVFRQDAS